MKYKIATSRRADSLTSKVNKMIGDGWKAVGGHGVIETFKQNVFAGTQHKHTIITYEYSQTLTKAEYGDADWKMKVEKKE